jgi:hypothetical protein
MRGAAIRRLTIGASLAGAIGALAILGFLALSAGQSAHAAADISLLAVDTNTAGNTTTAAASVTPHTETLGPVDPCTTVAAGSTFTVDVIVNAVPAGAGAADHTRLSGFGFNLIYDSTVLKIQAVNAKFLIASGGISYTAFDFSDAPPGPVANNFTVAHEDLSVNYDSGAGVLYRFTIQAIGAAGTASQLAIDGDPASNGNPQVIASNFSAYTIGTVQNGSINVAAVAGGPCIPVTPSPTPPPTPNPSAVGGEVAIATNVTDSPWVFGSAAEVVVAALGSVLMLAGGLFLGRKLKRTVS